jgi:hypothetical protein
MSNKKPNKKKAPIKKPVKNKKASTSKNHHILFCEPYTTDFKRARRWGVEIVIDDELYKKILKAPKKYKKTGRSGGNAYVFGKKYPISSYKYLGDHVNDGAQTGFIDLDILDAKRPTKDPLQVVLNNYDEENWDDRKALLTVRKELPCILFIGETFGGDVGAALYGHYTGKKLDSLIIDAYYFHPMK